MDIRILKYFLAVAREENISGAAAHLHVSQPALSKQLMDLEEELGVKLFVRGKRGITLTDEGVFLRKRAGEIVELLTRTEADLRTPEDLIKGNIYIGAGETRGFGIIAETIKDMRKEHPGVYFHIFSGDAETVQERLDNGLLDFGLLLGSVNPEEYAYLRLPFTDTWGVLMRRDNPLAVKETLSPDDVVALPLIYPRLARIRNSITDWLGKSYEQLNIIATYNLIFNASVMVRSGVGCVIGLDGLINMHEEDELCFRPFEPKLKVGMSIVWKKTPAFSRAAVLFLDMLKKRISTRQI